MEPVPFRGLDAGCNWVIGVLGWDCFAKGDWYEEAGLGAFKVDSWIDGA